MRQSIGLIGPGAMGLGITQALIRSGFEVFVRDIDPARNALARASAATVCVSPAEVASLKLVNNLMAVINPVGAGGINVSKQLRATVVARKSTTGVIVRDPS